MDISGMLIGGIELTVLIFGLTEAFKSFTGAEGRAVLGFVFGLGFLFVGLYAANDQGVVSPEVWGYIEMVVKALGGAIAAMGYYSFMKKLKEG